jgi:EAL domain-containing protein (putative c-di-GMP-specific phosphodiesterase class I)/GGDEF domain-containing protein
MFKYLRTKLTILYAGLFGAGLIMISGGVYAAIVSNAEHMVRSELATSGAVFDRLWALRSNQLQDGAGLLSRDFGFRSAVATRDETTISSALSNLKARLGIDLAFMVGTDGRIVSADGRSLGAGADDVINALQSDDNAAGVFMIGDMPYQAISAPVMAPTLTGWVVFANKLDRNQMQSIERLSAIPLDASVFHRDVNGGWITTGRGGESATAGSVGAFIDSTQKNPTRASQTLMTAEGKAVAVARPLPSMSKGRPVALVLSYPLARALAPYQPLLTTVLLTGLLGMVLLMVGSWMLARSVTRPISVLDEAVRRLQRGESATVRVETRDEIGRLSNSFNHMAAEIRERERRITHLALHDQTTDLPNRLALEQDIAALLADGDAGLVVVAALGIDRFTEVRGAIGYALANALVGGVGARLSQLRPGSAVARMATDVLGVAFRAPDLAAAQKFCTDLQNEIEAPLRLGDNTVDVSVTVGMAAYSIHAAAIDQLMERATIGLDQARATRRKVAFFDEVAYGDPASNLSLISEMLAALDDGGITIHHQPKYDMRKGEVTGAEVLVRWRHPVRGQLPPDLFVGMAEETGHIRALTEWVLSRAIEDQQILSAAGHDLLMSVNLSGRLLNDPEFAKIALDMITKAKARICFEITETAVMENPDLALKLIDAFAAAGIGISIDDYGAGLSSLTYLKQIRADELKIDKSFILAITEGQKDALLVRSTIDLAHSLGMKVTAEGIETDTAFALLAGMGCDIGQGYLIAKPMPLRDLLMFLKTDVEAHTRTAEPAMRVAR